MADAARLRRVWATVAGIPAGAVATYGDVAEAAGCTARQAGAALRATPPGMRLPWRRVVAAGGRIALPGDADRTQRLRLESEGVAFRGQRVRMDLHRRAPGGR